MLAALLVLGLICDLLVRPVSDKFFMSDEELKKPTNASMLANDHKDESDLSDFEDAVEEGKSIDNLAKLASHNSKKSPMMGGNLYLYLSWLAVFQLPTSR